MVSNRVDQIWWKLPGKLHWKNGENSSHHFQFCEIAIWLRCKISIKFDQLWVARNETQLPILYLMECVFQKTFKPFFHIIFDKYQTI